jgi:hypothetical protein
MDVATTHKQCDEEQEGGNSGAYHRMVKTVSQQNKSKYHDEKARKYCLTFWTSTYFAFQYRITVLDFVDLTEYTPSTSSSLLARVL